MTLASTAPHAARVDETQAVLRLMTQISVGDDVIHHGRVFKVRGISPMSATPRRALLEDIETGEDSEALLDELQPADDADESAG